MQQLTGLCSSDCRQWAIRGATEIPLPRKRARDACQARGHLPTPQRKSPESLEILGALFAWAGVT